MFGIDKIPKFVIISRPKAGQFLTGVTLSFPFNFCIGSNMRGARILKAA